MNKKKYILPNINNNSHLKKIILHRNITKFSLNIEKLGRIQLESAYFDEQDYAVLLIPPLPYEIPNTRRNSAMHTPEIHILFQFCLENKINVLRFNFRNNISYDSIEQSNINQQPEYLTQISAVYDHYYHYLNEKNLINNQYNKYKDIQIIPFGTAISGIFVIEYLLRRPSSNSGFILNTPIYMYDTNNLYKNNSKYIGIAYTNLNKWENKNNIIKAVEHFCSFINIKFFFIQNQQENQYEEILQSFKEFLEYINQKKLFDNSI